MFTLYILFFLSVAAPSTISAVIEKEATICNAGEVRCGSECARGARCDGERDCVDGSDEDACGLGSITLDQGELVLNREKRQLSCGRKEWQCQDGSCIAFHGKCDGVVDCADGSDERHALCRHMQCQTNWFRCTYGACVDGTAPCNGKQECADNSDELLPRCNHTIKRLVRHDNFYCADGSTIPVTSHCDGTPDCPDGSDETVRACAAKTCPAYLFQCAYGACVDRGADCNGIVDCADGSDEADDLCNSIPLTPVKPVTEAPEEGSCDIPPDVEHGRFASSTVGVQLGVKTLVTVNVSCQAGYELVGASTVYCEHGRWLEPIPSCVRMCELPEHPSVEYSCLVLGAVTGARACRPREPPGTVVSPRCRTPLYHAPTTLTFMRCIDGNWNYVARCTPECGRVTPSGSQLVIGGVDAKKGELPWHAGIYTKTTRPYKQICGGSLISNDIIVSAAHCFYNDVSKHLPASNFAAAVGKIYRPYDDTHDESQKSDVKEIKMTSRFQGASANFQDDIALVIVTTAFEYKFFIRPVCVDFDVIFERRQLQPGNKGKVAGWGLTAANGNASPILKVTELPYVSIDTCIRGSPPGFTEYITSDKICAGYLDAGSALCKGDSGGGLTFLSSDRGVDRYYLRGIVSTAPNNENLCNANTYTSFTLLSKHEHFVKEYWSYDTYVPGIENRVGPATFDL